MFPIRDDVPSCSFPVVTVGLMVVNAVIFLAELAHSAVLKRGVL